MKKKNVEILCTYIKEGTRCFYIDPKNIERYQYHPLPRLHIDLLQKLVKIEGIERIELRIKDTIPFEDTFEIYFSSWTKMIKCLKQIDQIFHIFTDGKYLIDLENNCITIQW